MSLDLKRLEKVRRMSDGRVEARCPACAAEGHDRKGEHLIIRSDGRFGCCAHPGDKEHRKRIFALAGDGGRRSLDVKPARVKMRPVIEQGILGRLGRVFPSAESPDASDGADRVGREIGEARTPRTGDLKSAEENGTDSRTPRTPLNPYTYEKKVFNIYVQGVGAGASEASEPPEDEVESEKGVRSVREQPDWKRRHPEAPLDESGRPLPYLGADGTLVIPFESGERYHWWKGGQALSVTREEVLRRDGRQMELAMKEDAGG